VDVRILYLDIDDEITTAATRVRAAETNRIAIVLPNGSRVATSRINFRLLARDATLNGKRLAIVASDPATRALAASAGLPIFASVTEYESSVQEDGASVAPSVEATPETVAEERDDTGHAAAAAAATAMGAAKASPRGSGGRKPRGDSSGAPTDATAGPVAHVGLAAAGATVAGAGTSTAGVAALPSDVLGPPPRDAAVTASHRAPAAVPAARVVADTPSEPMTGGSRVRPAPAGEGFAAGLRRTPVVAGAAVLGLALLVGGVGAFVFLPTATAVIAPRESVIGPIPLRIVADPTVTEPDPVERTVPAVTKDIPVEVTMPFEVTGKRVEETAATGTVRFRNKDFTDSNTIPKGSIVSTENGLRFRTERSITIPPAELVGLQVFPTSAAVKVRAASAGPEGNVEANAIHVIPRGENPVTLDVTNPEATRGGKRDEFPRVVQADITAATKAVDAQLATAFAEKLSDPTLVADGTTVFPETAALGETSYSVDPATLLGDEVESFELGAMATGTVQAVDESAVQEVAEANIAPQVQEGYALVQGSSDVTPSPGQVEAGVISFPVTITARQVLQIDPAAIEAEIRGKPVADAQAILDGYGQADLSVWPDWVGTIPTFDARVDVRTAEVVEP
jgi:hypothetical protein